VRVFRGGPPPFLQQRRSRSWRQSASAFGAAAVSVHVSYEKTALRGVLCRLAKRVPFTNQRIQRRRRRSQFDAVAAGKYVVECSLGGYEPAKSDVTVREDDARSTSTSECGSS